MTVAQPMPGTHHVQIAMPVGGEDAARAFYRDLLEPQGNLR